MQYKHHLENAEIKRDKRRVTQNGRKDMNIVMNIALSPFCFPCLFVYMYLCIRSSFILHFLIVSFLFICNCTFMQLCNVNCHWKEPIKLMFIA